MKLRVGSRKSPLAKAQAQAVIADVQAKNPALKVEWVWLTTTGDRIRDRPLSEVGGKGLFLKEIEQALAAGQIDVAIHSGKDIPADLAPGLKIVATPKRANPYDVLCLQTEPDRLADIAGTIGTGSRRRQFQVRESMPQADIVPLRGNVGTRLAKVANGDMTGVILAAAGIDRLGVTWAGSKIELRQMLPAVAQGTLAIEARAEADAIAELFSSVHDAMTWKTFLAERAVLRAVEGDCFTPLAAFATVDAAGMLELTAALWSDDGHLVWRAQGRGDDPELLGRNIGQQLLKRAGRT